MHNQSFTPPWKEPLTRGDGLAPITIPPSYKALTLTQPWATLVSSRAKQYETRSWKPPASLIGADIAIHAAKGFADMDVEGFCHLCASHPFKDALKAAYERGILSKHDGRAHLVPADIPRGAVVAIVRLVAVQRTEIVRLSIGPEEYEFGNYRDGRWAWKLDKVRVLREPIPVRGMQGIWNWTPGIPLEFLSQNER